MDFDSKWIIISFFIFQGSPFNLEKKKQKHLLRKCFYSHHTNNRIPVTAELFFKLSISPRYVFIGVKIC